MAAWNKTTRNHPQIFKTQLKATKNIPKNTYKSPVRLNLVAKIKCTLVLMKIGKMTYKITLFSIISGTFNFWHL